MKTDLIPVAVVVHLVTPLIAYLSMRNQHREQKDGAEVFRYAPGAAWFILIAAMLFMIIVAFIAWNAPPGEEVPLLTFSVAELALLVMAMYGVYVLTLRIQVSDTGFAIASLLRKRVVPFDQIGSATDRITGSYRTLDVKTRSGKRVLYLGSTFIPDYAALADLIQHGAKQGKQNKSENAH